MANKFLDENGLLYLWAKIVNRIKNNVVNDLNSTDTNKSLSAAQGKVLNDKIENMDTDLKNLGVGDMLKSRYDLNDNGQVDKSDDSDKLGGYNASYYASADSVNAINDALKDKANNSELATVAKTGSYNDLTDKPTDFAPSSHTHQQGEINGLAETIENVTEIANGKRKTEVFDTVDDMNTWLADSANTEGLKVGDVFLIRAVGVPDYWWDGNTTQILETTKVEINVISNAEIDAIIATS